MNYDLVFYNKIHLFSRCIIAFTLTIIISGSAGAQETLTLSQAIQKGFLNRKSIQAGRSDEIISRLQTKALYRRYWPQADIEYNYLYNPILQTSILPIGIFNPAYSADATKSIQFGTKWSQTAGLYVNLPLLDLSISRQIHEAKLQERIAATGQAQTEYELAYTVAQTYIDILIQQSRIRSAIADTNRTGISYRLLQNRFDAQRLLKSDLNKGKINQNNTLQQLRNAMTQLIEDKVYLMFLIGVKDIEQPDISIDTSFFGESKLPISDIQHTGSIPELQQLDLKNEMATMLSKTERAKYLPTLSLKGYLGANQYTNNFDPTAPNSWFGLSYVGIDLKYPLFSAEDKQKKIEQIRLQGVQYSEQKEDKASQYYKDGIVAKIKMELMLSQLKTQEENMTLSTESITIIQARVLEGQESASTLNTEEANLKSLNAEYQISKKQYWQYFLDYLRASGSLQILWQ